MLGGITKMMDYHVHTLLCNHASGSMEKYIETATQKGLSEICFLDHLTLNKNGRSQSMSPMDVPVYYYAVRRLQAGCRDKIKIRVGLEVDFCPELDKEASSIVSRFDFDMIGGSVHFIEERNIASSRAADKQKIPMDENLFDKYLELLDSLAQSSYVDIVCHLDMIKKFGARPGPGFYEKIDPILDKIADSKKVVEVNTSGLHHAAGQTYPDETILKKCRQKNIPVCLGSDAHRPEQVGRSFDTALDQIKNAGYDFITGFERKKRFKIPLAGFKGE